MEGKSNQTKNQNGNFSETKQEGLAFTEIFPIESARNNAGAYNNIMSIKKFSNKIISEVNNGIRRNSEEGEYDAHVVLSCLEIFGDYPIHKDDEMLQTVLNNVTKKYINSGYAVTSETIESSWGTKGIVFTISWRITEEEKI